MSVSQLFSKSRDKQHASVVQAQEKTPEPTLEEKQMQVFTERVAIQKAGHTHDIVRGQ